MDDNLATDNSKESSICPNCQKPAPDKCLCRESQEASESGSETAATVYNPESDTKKEPEDKEESKDTTRVPPPLEARAVSPDPQSRSTPPPPDVRSSSSKKDPPARPDLELPESEESSPAPEADPQHLLAESSQETALESANQASPSPVPPPKPRSGRSVRTANPKWGWVLIVGPLLVALAIIAWFHFRVLPPVSQQNNLPSAVDFPVEGVASRPDEASQNPTPQETTPPQPPETTTPEVTTPDPEPEPPVDTPPEDPEPDDEGQGLEEDPNPEEQPPADPLPITVDPNQFQRFSVQEFINLFDDISGLPNLTGPQPVAVTGDMVADEELQSLAIRAGYIPQPVVADGSQLVGVHRMQPLLAQHWAQLEEAARAVDHSLTITTGYLSGADQANIFRLQLEDNDFSSQALAAAAAKVLIPGYSPHQTGFAIDVVDGNNPATPFTDTAAYAWLAADNFAIAKHFGFIPGHNAGGQGQAEQTAFKLLYVGRDRLLAN